MTRTVREIWSGMIRGLIREGVTGALVIRQQWVYASCGVDDGSKLVQAHVVREDKHMNGNARFLIISICLNILSFKYI